LTGAALDSRELGLLLARQLFGLDDLHYGWWDPDLSVSVGNFPRAQQRFCDFLIAKIDALPGAPGLRLLDVGCGTGSLLRQLRTRGYDADGLSPSQTLNRIVREQLAASGGGRLFECRFEDLASDELAGHYDVILFSESFQFIKLPQAMEQIRRILRPGGHVLICDVFTLAPTGPSPIRSGHRLQRFLHLMQETPLVQVEDQDITASVSPTIELLRQILEQRVVPAAGSLGRYLSDNYPVWSLLGRLFLQRRFRRVRDHYFSGAYNQQTFEAFKSYRYFDYMLPASVQELGGM